MPHSYVIHAVTMLDGFGDLIYFLHWLKLYHRLAEATENKLIIFARSKHNLYVILKNLHNLEPTHPIFLYFSLELNIATRTHRLKIKDDDMCAVIPIFSDGVCNSYANVDEIFPSIQKQDYLTVYYISCCHCYLYNADQRISNSYGIFEFDSPFPSSSLGLGEENLGILTDPDGITGNENLADGIAKLSEDLRLQIFQDINITTATALDFLATTPIVFGYFQAFVNSYVLHAILQSPLIQTAIAQHKVPLFFITSIKPLDDMPDSIQEALKAKKIRLLSPLWLSRREYQNVSEVFLNKATLSIVIPSGDNTLSSCFQAGKFPFYAHKWIKHVKESENFKCTIFSELKKIMNKEKEQGRLPASGGFRDCLQTVDSLTTRYTCDSSIEKMRREGRFIYRAFYAQCIKNKKAMFFSERARFLTKEALDYFHDHVAPLIMKDYDFKYKTLPNICNLSIKQ